MGPAERQRHVIGNRPVSAARKAALTVPFRREDIRVLFPDSNSRLLCASGLPEVSSLKSGLSARLHRFWLHGELGIVSLQPMIGEQNETNGLSAAAADQTELLDEAAPKGSWVTLSGLLKGKTSFTKVSIEKINDAISEAGAEAGMGGIDRAEDR